MASGLSRDLGAGRGGATGVALGVLPTLSRLTSGGLSLPMNSSLGSLRFSYQNLLGGMGGQGGGMGTRSSFGSPSASFSSSHYRAGKIDFSTSATVGGMSAGMSSFGGGAGGGGRASGMLGSSGGGGSGGGPGGGQGGQGAPGGGGSGGEKHPTASLSLHLSF